MHLEKMDETTYQLFRILTPIKCRELDDNSAQICRR